MPDILKYQGGKPFAFISYSSKDKSTITEDVIELQKRGVNIWFDADLTVGTDWFTNEVKLKILQCKVILFYASKNSIQSKQVLKELETAIERKKSIIPICILPLNTTIANYVDEYSHELTIDIETAYKISDIISGDNTFIPHKTDTDYYCALIEKGLKRLAPGIICTDIMSSYVTSPSSTPEYAPIAPTPTSVDTPTPVKEKAVAPSPNHPVVEALTEPVPNFVAPAVKIAANSLDSANDSAILFNLLGKQYTVTKLKDFLIKSAEVILSMHSDKIDDALKNVANLSADFPPIGKTETYFRGKPNAISVSGRQFYVGTSFGTSGAVSQVKSLLRAVGLDTGELLFGESDVTVQGETFPTPTPKSSAAKELTETSLTLTAPSVKIDTTSPNSVKDNKRKFKEWFMTSGKSEYTANVYIKQLSGELARGLGLGDAVSENLFEYGDTCSFEQVLEVIRGGALATASLPNSLIAYSDFLKTLSAPVLLQQESAEIVCNHTVTNTDVSYRIIRFKKSSNIYKSLTPNKEVTLHYGDIVHKTKVHSVEMGRISSVPFMRNMPVGKELVVTFDGKNTITLKDVLPQN